jgi:predicted secreted protein
MLHEIIAGATPDQVDVTPGDELEVHLEETPTTGYQWTCDKPQAGPLNLEDNHFQTRTLGAIGGGGTRIYRFSVTGVGSTSLHFYKRRSWESDPAGEFQLNVRSLKT